MFLSWRRRLTTNVDLKHPRDIADRFPFVATFEYELVVDGCDGANTPLVTVYFCPDIYCNTSDVVIQTFDIFNAGSTTFNIELDFNPTALKFLPFVDEW